MDFTFFIFIVIFSFLIIFNNNCSFDIVLFLKVILFIFKLIESFLIFSSFFTSYIWVVDKGKEVVFIQLLKFTVCSIINNTKFIVAIIIMVFVILIVGLAKKRNTCVPPGIAAFLRRNPGGSLVRV